MTTHLLDWIADPSPTTGIYRATPEGWRFSSYRELAARARGHARALRDAGVSAGDVVGIVDPDADEFVMRFFAVLLAGATPNPLAPPFPVQDPQSYRQQLVRLVAVAHPSAVSAAPDLHELIAPVLGNVPVLGLEEIGADPTGRGLVERVGPEIALLQFTSGSSGTPKAVQVPTAALEANLAAIHRWVGPVDADRIATWLPPYHDMGLIGCLLGSVVIGLDIDAMSPMDFLRDPHKWLSCFGSRGATISAAPNFALPYVLSKVSGQEMSGLDFARWRMLILGAERIDPVVLREFLTALAPFGLRPEAACPAYGMAEATLAVSGVAVDQTVQVIGVDPRNGATEGPYELATAALENDKTWLVGCGAPLEAVTVDVVTAGAAPGAGELFVGGPSVAADYRTASGTVDLSRDERGRLGTGDAGYLVDGQVYPVGRIGDSVKIRAVTVYAEDIESAVARATGTSSNRVVVLAGLRAGSPHVAVLFEHADAEAAPVRRIVTSLVGTDALVRLFDAPRGTINRTTSGKPRRRRMWAKLCAGDYDAFEVGVDPAPQIRVDDLLGPEIKEFLQEHIDEMRSISPPESKHALDLAGLRVPEVTFWTMWSDEVLLGCGALKDLGDGHAEIKSMRTSRVHKQQGLGSRLLSHMLTHARERGFRRISLETGAQDFFEPARRLYAKHGFEFCGPFGSYREDPNSVFMTCQLAAQEAS
ncbi:GNAT family N-acetyltransferase [Nocardia thailandica]|uniref:GNAT family N-acetyltransferase n=1 Tax=Nocardia thailandica TaxID=257275 RepID=UPI0002FAE719|nr:GNAT family N-acetyltransferase [Nocardia thailandica]